MMKKIFLVFGFLITFSSKGQNIINNPSFEVGGVPDHTIPLAMIGNATGWYDSPCDLHPAPAWYSASPDLLDPDAHCTISVPANKFCINKYASDGERYVHISGYTEQVTTFLMQPLLANCEYKISFDMSNYGPVRLDGDCNPVGSPSSSPVLGKTIQVVLRSSTGPPCNELVIYNSDEVLGNCVDPWNTQVGFYTFTDAEVAENYDLIEFRMGERFGGLSGGLIYGGSALLDNVCLQKNLPEITILSTATEPCSLTGTTLYTAPSGVYDNCEWFNEDGFSIGFGASVDVFETGVYSVNCWNGTGQFDESCGISASIQVFVSISPEVELGDELTVCFGEDNPVLSSEYIHSGDVSYLWTTPSGHVAVSPTLTATTEGLYCLTVTDNETGCENTDCVDVTFAPEIIGEGGSFSACIGEDLEICVTPAGLDYGYYWFGSSTPVTTNCYTVTPTLEIGTLTYVTIEDEFGCTKVVTITYDGDPIPDLSILDVSPTCACDNVELTATSSSTGVISWGGIESPSITVNPCFPTSYVATIVDDNGCTNVASTTVYPLPAPTTFFNEAAFCYNEAAVPFFSFATDGISHPPFEVTGGSLDTENGIVYNFDGYTATYSFDPSLVEPGVHIITVCEEHEGDIICCTDIEITVCPSPDFIFPDFCINDGPFFLSATLPSGVLSIVTDGDDEGFLADLSYNPGLAGVGLHTFTICYVFADKQCCTEYTVNVFDAPVVTTTLDEVICLPDGPAGISLGTDFVSPTSYLSDYFSPYIGADPSDPATGYFTPATYITQVDAPAVSFFTFLSTGLSEGVYPVTYNITNQNGCVGSATGQVTLCNAPDFDLIWDGCDLISADVHMSTGSCGGPYTYDWSGPGIYSVGVDFINVNALGLYTCTVTNAAGCSKTLDVGVKCDPPKVKIANITKCELPATLVASVASSCPIVSTIWTDASGIELGTETTFVATEEGEYTFTATDVLGCSTTITYTLEIPEIEIVFDAIPPISLCEEPGLIPITYSSTGVECMWLEIPTGFDPITGLFDPVEAEPGEHLFVLECSKGACVGVDSLIVIVLDDLFWHHTTQGAFQFDEYNDVETDDEGNVYAVGTFYGQTSLINPATGLLYTISTVDPLNRAAFVVKFDKCGELIWITHGQGASGEFSEGIDLTVDSENDYVYVVGNFFQDISLISGAGPDATCATTTFSGGSGGEVGFIARLGTTSGCVDMLEGIDPASPTKLTSVTLDQGTVSFANAEVYVSGNIKVTGAPTSLNGTHSFVFRYDISNAPSPALGTELWSIQATGPASSYQLINEIDYDESLNRIWAIGTYRKRLQLSDGGPTFMDGGPGPLEKAFVVGYDNLGVSIDYYWSERMTTANVSSSGNGISVDELTGNVYLTGSFYETHNNPFGFGGETWPNDATSNAYHMSFQSYITGLDPALNWSRESDAGSLFGNNAQGTGVSFVSGNAHFVGNFNNDLTIESSGGTTESILHTAIPISNKSHIFTVTYDEATGTASGLNATEDLVGESDHISSAIHANQNGKSFVVGRHTGQMDYQVGDPWSESLISSGSPFVYNAFVMRVDRADGGSYRSQEVVEDESATIKEEINKIEIVTENLDISVYPNPTNGELKVEVNGFDYENEYTIQLRSITGKLIWSETLLSSQSNFDLSELENGMYLISLVDGENNITKRIVKQ